MTANKLTGLLLGSRGPIRGELYTNARELEGEVWPNRAIAYQGALLEMENNLPENWERIDATILNFELDNTRELYMVFGVRREDSTEYESIDLTDKQTELIADLTMLWIDELAAKGVSPWTALILSFDNFGQASRSRPAITMEPMWEADYDEYLDGLDGFIATNFGEIPAPANVASWVDTYLVDDSNNIMLRGDIFNAWMGVEYLKIVGGSESFGRTWDSCMVSVVMRGNRASVDGVKLLLSNSGALVTTSLTYEQQESLANLADKHRNGLRYYGYPKPKAVIYGWFGDSENEFNEVVTYVTVVGEDDDSPVLKMGTEKYLRSLYQFS